MSGPVMTVRPGKDGERSLFFWCPGCDDLHMVTTPKWDWDENRESPTISPSILVRYDFRVDRPSLVCHSFLRAGRWEFLGDCTHAFAGQRVDMIPVPDWLVAEEARDA